VEERKPHSFAAYYQQLTDEKRRGTAGGRGTCGRSTLMPHGTVEGEPKIVVDRFQIMREMTKAGETLRKQEHRGFLRAGEDSPLTGPKYLWLFSDERRTDHHADSFVMLQTPNLKVGRALGNEMIRARTGTSQAR
jgi:hypothetical protein